MARSRKTSARAARSASKVMRGRYSPTAKRAAASALSQRAPRSRKR